MWSTDASGDQNEIGERHPGEHIVVLSHGAAIIAYLTDVLQLEPAAAACSVLHQHQRRKSARNRRMVGGSGDLATRVTKRSGRTSNSLRDKLGRPGCGVTAVDQIPEVIRGFTYFVTVEGGKNPARYVPPPSTSRGSNRRTGDVVLTGPEMPPSTPRASATPAIRP